MSWLAGQLRAVGLVGWARVALYAVLAVIVVYWGLPRLDRLWGGQEDARTIQNANAWLRAGKARRQAEAAAEARVTALAAAAEANRHVAGQHRQAVVALLGSLAQLKTAHDSIPPLLGAVHELQRAAVSDSQAYQKLWAAYVLDSTVVIPKLQLDLAGATANLRQTVKVADCHMFKLGFLPKCLGRKASFVAGAATAVVAAVALHVHF